MIGELNQRASLLARTLTPDGGGGISETWNVIATVWARLESLSGNESFVAQAIRTQVRYRITLRRNAAAEPGCRIVIGGRTFHIADVLDDGPQAPVLTLLCEELP